MTSPDPVQPEPVQPKSLKPEPPRPERTVPVAVESLAREIGAQLEAPTGAGLSETSSAAVRGVTLDSRAARPGDLWCALPGARAHGADFAAQAASLGAVAALTDADGADRCLEAGLIALVHPYPRAATARASALVLGEPATRMTTIGVTGTNGKTSVTTMLERTLLALGRPAGLIGTSGTSFCDAEGREHRIATKRTTPESPDVQGILARMAEAGVQTVAMEVSSHAMVLRRADSIRFDAVCFTNLSQDHLDFHGDMEHYYAAKASLLTPEHARRALVCVDDEWGRRLAREVGERGDLPLETYGLGEQAQARAVDLRPMETGIGTRFTLRRPGGESVEMTSPLPGRHYVANTVAVALLLEALGIDVPAAAPVIARAAVVPGRMEQVAQTPVRGIVDYSHTEDALIQALTTLRALPGTARLIVVMGAGGDRDRTKRPLMGAAAARLADVVVVTDDNPRTEDPDAIRAAVVSGIPADSPAEVHEVAGRGEAIARAVSLARPGDTVLVAGKGAETGQDIGGVIHPFDDRAVLRELLGQAPAQEGQPC